jgi:hypothetical protein
MRRVGALHWSPHASYAFERVPIFSFQQLHIPMPQPAEAAEEHSAPHRLRASCYSSRRSYSQKKLYNAPLLLHHLSAMAGGTPGYRKRQLLENYCAKFEVDPNKTLSEYYKALQTLLTKGTSL